MKKRIIFVFIILILNFAINYTVLANTDIEENIEDYSEAYKRYLNLSQEEKEKVSIIPRKYNIPMSQKDNKRKVQANALPSSFILTGKDTNNDGIVNKDDIVVEKYGNIELTIEDQYEYGLCWAFASINSLETNLALNGYNNNNYSELHLDYMDYLYGDLERDLHGAGNFYCFMDYQDREDGVVLESEVPYNSIYYTDKDIAYLENLNQRARVENYVEMPTVEKYNNCYYSASYAYSLNYEPVKLTDSILKEFRNKVKNHIMKNGSLYAVIDSEELKLSTNSNKYVLNGKTNYADHAITIIGWDDNFSRNNFPESCRPEKDGAYIALNTWTYESDSYFFYISYEDFLVEQEMSGIESAYITEPLFISIKSNPNKINYVEGEEFDKTGLVVIANYQNGSTKEIKNYSISPNKLSSNDEYVTITYTEGKTTQSVNLKVNVKDKTTELGWRKINNSWYYFCSSDMVYIYWHYIDGKWYYFTENGEAVTDWNYIDGKWYYFNSNYAMVTGWQYINNKWYYFNNSGSAVTNWNYIDGKWYYFNSSSCAMVTGWQYINNKWYYFNNSGSAVTSWNYIDKKWYYFNSSCAMVTGWQYINNKWYYFENSGDMFNGTEKTINGKINLFDSSGAWIKEK